MNNVDIVNVTRVAKEELKRALSDYAALLPPTLIEMGKVALSGRGKVMSSAPESAELAADPPRWPLAVVLSYQAAAGVERRDTWREAIPAVVAVEIAMAAADLIDEIADQDPSIVISRYGPGQALNTANLMLVMAQQILLKYALQSAGEERDRTLAALGALEDMLVEAAVGQHLDMRYEGLGATEVTVEMSAEMTAKKAGALIGGACRMGALMSGASPQVVELITRFGREIGGIAQLKNDLRDVLPRQGSGVRGRGSETDDGRRTTDDGTPFEAQADPRPLAPDPSMPGPKTDLRLRKRTLPITFALHDDSPQPSLLQRVFGEEGEGEVADEEELRQAVTSAGGAHFTELIIDIHRQNASQTLEELEALQPGSSSVLSLLLRSFDPNSD